MNRSGIRYIFYALFWAFLLLPFRLEADIVYPARLELKETQPGIYEVYFVLPVIQGKVLKAAPVFPEFCKALEDPRISGNAYIKELRWSIACEPEALYGQSIGISGLLGSQIDIILQITTLDNRTYRTTLNPASAWFEVPYPPTGWELFSEGILKGMRLPVGRLIFTLLLLTLILKEVYSSNRLITLSTLGIILGYTLTTFELLRAPGWIFGISALLLAATLIIDMLSFKKPVFNRSNLYLPVFFALFFLGAQGADIKDLSGYTQTESALLLIYTLTGIALGVTLCFHLLKQGLYLVGEVVKNKEKGLQVVTGLTGILTIGLLIYQSSLLWKTPSLFPPIPVLLWVVLLIVITAGLYRIKIPGNTPSWMLTIPFLLGLILGYSGLNIPYLTEITLAAGITFLTVHVLRAERSVIPSALLYTLTGMGSGLFLAGYTEQHLSYALARGIEFIAILIFLAALILPLIPGITERTKRFESRVTLPQLSIFLVIILSGILIINRSEYNPGSIGFSPRLEIPVLSISLFIAGLLMWPKRKRIHKDLGVNRAKPVGTLIIAGLALCFLPVKTAISDPWFNPDKMDRRQVQQTMEQVLSNTYNAFNIEDEERLFEALSSNVDEALLDNIYLDSRRRLTMGLREGSEVTVEEVSVDLLGEAADNTGETALSYPASWTVTARVKHLKHIHYRRNRYTGTIEMKTINDSWKISKIILDSEEREVIPSATL